jgi:3',5'-cyclic-AMP phosphodiesterase
MYTAWREGENSVALVREPFFIQISDTHLFEDPTAKLWDVAPEPMLDRALEELNKLDGRPAFIIVSGDCSSDGSIASYERLGQKIGHLGVPVFYLPGNHDDPQILSRILCGRELPPKEKLTQSFEAHGWRFILLDSSVPGEDGGALGDAQRAWLRTTLAAEPRTPTIINVHHNPIPVGSAWLDPMTIADANALSAILDTSTQVRAVLFGHVHQVFETNRDGAQYLSAPSTFFQFKPNSLRFGKDERPAGVRIVRLNGDTVRSAIYRFGEPLPPI